jgi:hypothetical protein
MVVDREPASFCDVPLRWRLTLAIVLAVTALGAFMPNAVLSAEALPAQAVALVVHEPPVAPSVCVNVSCNKGTPSPATPPLNTVGLWVALPALLAYAAVRAARRTRPNAVALARGVATPLFHPPRFL